jgi:hypothetical protein
MFAARQGFFASQGRTPVVATANGNVKISTGQSKFGGASGEFDGNDDYLTLASLPGSGAGDFTCELFARFDILPHNQTIGSGSYMLISNGGSTNYFLINRSGAGSQVNVQVATNNRYGSFTQSGVDYAINTWYHIAIVRSGGVWKVFWDGTELSTFTNDFNFTNSGRTEDILHTTIGRFVDVRGSWDGYMDEFRVSKVARYSSAFSPPTAAFVNDADTLMLLHMNGTNGSTVFTDDAA